MKKRIIFALVFIGITSMSAQIVLMRELLIVFYGNELTLGITLASWLFWVAFGSWGIGRIISSKIKDKIATFASFEIILSFLLPLSLIATRLIPFALKFSAGEIVGIVPMSIATFILLMPICVLCGFLFVLGCEVYESNTKGAAQIGYVYIVEAVGASIGGLLTSLILIKYLNPIYIMFLIGVLNLLAALLLTYKKRTIFSLSSIIFIGFILFFALGKVEILRQYSLKKQWTSFDLLTSQNSIYGNIAITKREDIVSVFENGLYAFSVPDKLSSELNAHFPLLEHPNPKDVLLIGGGSSGMLSEVLKQPVRHVDYVELDPLIIDLARKYLPSNEALNNKEVRVIANIDGRLFVKRVSQTYDVVIMSLPEPYTAQLNRFYTKEFFSEVYKILNTNGVFSFCLYSNPNYISGEQAQFYLTIENTLKSIFPDVKISPGQANYFFASNSKGLLTLDADILMRRLKQRQIDAKYIREYYLYSELSQERIDSFNERLAQESVSAINTDFHPIGYYYDMVLWSTFFKYNLKKIFQTISPFKIYLLFAVIFILLYVPILFSSARKRISNWSVLACVGTTGFAEITFQIITLLSFQVLYGYVFYKLGLILTSFMIGLILGSIWVTKLIEEKKADYNLFVKTQVAILIYPLILPILFLVFAKTRSEIAFWFGSNIVFTFLPIIPGFIGGFQFPLANSLYMKNKNVLAGYSAGLTYGIDLFGSCIGALLTAIILIPIIGILAGCLLIAGLNLVGLVLLLRSIKNG